MRSRVEMTRHLLEYGYNMMVGHLEGLTLEEALFVPEGGYRSVLGNITINDKSRLPWQFPLNICICT